jgi:hypothetical protein
MPDKTKPYFTYYDLTIVITNKIYKLIILYVFINDQGKIKT